MLFLFPAFWNSTEYNWAIFLYYFRIVLEQPGDPIQFLINSIESKPFEPHAYGFTATTTTTQSHNP
jgi:hypothetical protein